MTPTRRTSHWRKSHVCLMSGSVGKELGQPRMMFAQYSTLDDWNLHQKYIRGWRGGAFMRTRNMSNYDTPVRLSKYLFHPSSLFWQLQCFPPANLALILFKITQCCFDVRPRSLRLVKHLNNFVSLPPIVIISGETNRSITNVGVKLMLFKTISNLVWQFVATLLGQHSNNKFYRTYISSLVIICLLNRHKMHVFHILGHICISHLKK